MRDAADAAGVVHLLGTEFRFATGQALLTRTVRSGAVGTPRSGLFMLHIPTLADAAAELPTWWERAEDGGGWLGAYGAHVVDQVRTTIGEIDTLTATLQTLRPSPADDRGRHILGRAPYGGRLSGAAAQLLRGRRSVHRRHQDHRDGRRRMDPGRRGVARHRSRTCPGARAGGPAGRAAGSAAVGAAPHRPTTCGTRWARIWSPTRDCSRASGSGSSVSESPGDPVAATFDDGVANQAVLDAVRAASSSGTWVEVARP